MEPGLAGLRARIMAEVVLIEIATVAELAKRLGASEVAVAEAVHQLVSTDQVLLVGGVVSMVEVDEVGYGAVPSRR